MAEERLQKILANSGVASRRKAEELIVAGRVSVNGRTVVELGSKADLAKDEVKVDGQRLQASTHHVYFAFHKPRNVITTVSDPERRETVMSYFKGLRERIYPVGRLDYASEGLLLLTNDGDFANRISSPGSHMPKTYLVKVNGILSPEQEIGFRKGVPMHGRRTAPARLRRIREGANPWYEVTISEGRQNQIRIMFKHFGFLVEKLKRTKIGFLELGVLKPGAYRTLTRQEVERFQRTLAAEEHAAAGGAAKETAAGPPRRHAAAPRRMKPRASNPRESKPWEGKPRESKPLEGKPRASKPREGKPPGAASAVKAATPRSRPPGKSQRGKR
jgi:23S rRNA pseudouridine2605 synthase